MFSKQRGLSLRSRTSRSVRGCEQGRPPHKDVTAALSSPVPSRRRPRPQARSPTSSFRSQGTWTRKLIPDSLDVSQATYELPPLNVQGLASDLVTVLMLVGTTCLGVAVYGACSTRRSKKWDSVYDGERLRRRRRG